MGQAQDAILKASETVEFDFSKPALHVVEGDKDILAKLPDGSLDPTVVVSRGVRATISAMIQAAFPQGMDRRDGRIWAGWLELLDDLTVPVATITRAQLTWLKKHFMNDDIKVAASMAQWREAVVEYLNTIE